MSRGVSLNAVRDAGLMERSGNPPEGTWNGRLIAKAWGKKVNLICFFENLDTGEIHRCSVFRSRGKSYTPRDGVVDFSEEGIEGRVYEITTGLNSKGNVAWHSARLLD